MIPPIVFRTAAALLAVALWFPAAAFAQEDRLEVKPRLGLTFHPSLSVSETYSDNLFSTAHDTKSGFVTTVTPDLGLQLNLGMGASGDPFNGFSFGANADIASSGKFSDLNRVNWELYGRGAFVVRERLAIEFGDTYTPAYLTFLESTTGTQEKYVSNVARVALKYDFREVWQVRFGFTNTMLDYDESAYRSRDENLLSTGVAFKVLPDLLTVVAFDYTWIDYDDAASLLDGTRQNASVGAEWDVNERTRGTARVGYVAVAFDDPSQKGYSTIGLAADLRYQPTDLATVTFKADRNLTEGKYEGTRFIVSTGVLARLSYRFPDRFTTRLDAGYFVEEFSEINPGDSAQREDKSFRVGTGVNYAFRSWLDFDLSYRYLDRASNIDIYAVRENAVTLQGTIRL